MRLPVLSFSFLAAVLLAACAPPTRQVEISFVARFGDLPLDCSSVPAMSDLRFYVHDIRLLDANGEELPVAITTDGAWQADGVALLDLETGEGGCMNGSPQTNTVVRGTVAGSPAGGLRMEVGVPVELNHADPLLAAAPLARTAMHWHWKSGYKFLRAGVSTASGDGFWMHLGSSRCSGTIGDIKGCAGANRPRIDLPGFDPQVHVVVVDLEALTAGLDMEDGNVSNCQSGPAEDTCDAPFTALGLDFASGDTLSAAPVFRAASE